MSYKIVKITSFYRGYLSDYYRRKPDIVKKNYQEQFADLTSEGFAWADFFSKHFRSIGIEAHDIIRNAVPLQLAWARENNCKPENVLLCQLKKIKPNVVFLQDAFNYTSDFVNQIRREIPSIRLVISHVCSPHSIEQQDLFKSLDFILVCSPGFQNYFNRNGVKSYLFYHGFEHTLLPIINDNINTKDFNILFIGNFFLTKDFHDYRLKLIESLLEAEIPLTIISDVKIEAGLPLLKKQMAYILMQILRRLSMKKIIQKFPPLQKASLIKAFPRKALFSKKFLSHVNEEPVYGVEMLKKLSKSKICLNVHGGISGEYAANLRLFEVTGAGSLLVTENKKNISDLFVPDKEIITYSSAGECKSKIKWLMDNPEELKKISDAGHKRTISDHTLFQRVQLLNQIIVNELNSHKTKPVTNRHT